MESVFESIREVSPPQSHPAEEGGGFPFYDTLRDEGGREEAAGRVKVLTGICGWAPRQLDGEVRRGGWKVARADAHTALVAVAPLRSSGRQSSTTDAEAVWRHLFASAAVLDISQLLSAQGILQRVSWAG